VRNFKIDFFESRIGYFSTDTSGRLVRLIIHDQDLEVVRKDLVPQAQEIIKKD
jgi:molybdopterin biosynthesis enzyme MoaB